MSLNWDDLRVFLAVAREGNLSSAARFLKVSQPTVGRRLRALEESLSARLFDRLPDGFVPTPAGMELLPLAEAMARTAEAVDRRQAAFADSVKGTVRISVVEVIAQFLTDHLAELRARRPEIEIELAVSHGDANLSRREADLLLRECLPDSPGLVARKLGCLAYAVYGARHLVESEPAASGESRYRLCDWVAYDDDHAGFPGQDWLVACLDGRAPAVRVNNGMVLHDAVVKGAGLGVLPCFAGDGEPSLQRLTPPIPGVVNTQHMIVHRDLRRQPGVRVVMDELAELFKREAPRLAGKPTLRAITA